MQEYTIWIAGVVINFRYLNHVNVNPFAASHFLITDTVPHIFIDINVEDSIQALQLTNPEITTISWEMQSSDEGKCFNMHDKDKTVATLFVNNEYTSARLCITTEDMHDIVPPLFTFFPVLSGFLLRNKLGFLFHGAMVEIDGKCIVLTGASGVGKSTLSQLIQRMGYMKWGDDRLIFTMDKDDNVYCHSTPFDLKLKSWANKSCELSAVVCLSHSHDGKNHLQREKRTDKINKIVLSNFIPLFERKELAEHFLLYKKVFSRVPVYDYAFVPNEESVINLIRTLINKE